MSAGSPLHVGLSSAVSGGVRAVLFSLLMGAALYPAALHQGKLPDTRPPGPAAGSHVLAPSTPARRADFGGTPPSDDVRALADGVARADDSRGTAFVIIDKKAAHLYVFNAQAQLMGRSAVLLGSALGDTSVPGIGERPVEAVKPEERTTPAGRFLGERGRNARGEDVVWVDYDAAVSMHRVVTANAAERRLERLATPTASDNRISYGCINVPVAFYELHIRPTFAVKPAVIYVLPDSSSPRQFFEFPS